MNEREREFADAARVIDESVLMKIVHRTTLSQSPIDRGLLTAAMTAALKGPLYVLAAVTACITHIVRVKPRRARATMCQPRKHDRRESCARGSGAIAQRRFEKAHHALRMDGKVGAVPPRPLYQPLAIHARSNQLHRIGLD